MNTVLGKLNVSIISSHDAIDKIKKRYDILRNARSSYLKVRDGKHGLFYKRKLEKEKNNYEQTFKEIFDDYFYFTNAISQDLAELLKINVPKNPELSKLLDRIKELYSRCPSFTENVNSEYLLQVGIEEFDSILLYARNFLYQITGVVDQFKKKYNDYIAREEFIERGKQLAAKRRKAEMRGAVSVNQETNQKAPGNQ